MFGRRTERLPAITAARREEPHEPRSTVRPSAPPSSGGVKRASCPSDTPPRDGDAPLGPRFRSPMQQALDVLRQLHAVELADVMRDAERRLGMRGQAPDPDVVSRLLAVVLRLNPRYQDGRGVPLSLVRVELPEVDRFVLDRALLQLEERGLIRLVPTSPRAAFVEAAAGIQSPRGLLYFCAAPEGAELP